MENCQEKGQIKMKNAGSVIFVPFTGKGVRDQSEVEIE
jgi:hypothetical protein